MNMIEIERALRELRLSGIAETLSTRVMLRISGFLDTKFDTVDIEFGTAVNELHRPPCRELHEAHRLLDETGDTYAAGDPILMGS